MTQLNLLLYSLPLSLKFPNSPPLVIFSLLMVLALFKPYTCVGDYVVPFAMLPLWLHLFKYLQQFYVVAVATVVSGLCIYYLHFFNVVAVATVVSGLCIYIVFTLLTIHYSIPMLK